MAQLSLGVRHHHGLGLVLVDVNYEEMAAAGKKERANQDYIVDGDPRDGSKGKKHVSYIGTCSSHLSPAPPYPMFKSHLISPAYLCLILMPSRCSLILTLSLLNDPVLLRDVSTRPLDRSRAPLLTFDESVILRLTVGGLKSFLSALKAALIASDAST